MNCEQVQACLSEYLYGELDFAQEEALEQHLTKCDQCQRTLAREKAWHTVVRADQLDVPLHFLAECRERLGSTLASEGKRKSGRFASWQWKFPWEIPVSGWPVRLALASFLVFIGFSSGRWLDRSSWSGDIAGDGLSTMGLLNGHGAHIRDVQPTDDNRVRIVVDQINERTITGPIRDQHVRRWLLAAARGSSDPGIRVDSVDMLKNHSGDDVREALLYSAQHDANAAVRLTALEGLRKFIDDPAAQQGVRFVLEHDSNSAVRSEAMDVLAPSEQSFEMTPELAGTLEQIMRTGEPDDYVHARCLQLLRQAKASTDVY